MRRRGLRSDELQITNYKSQIAQRGYMLITLMLVIALAAMALLAMLPEIGQQIKRDQEEELRHRGNSYMRAIQHFYKKFGRYPTRVEELENTNKIRFLRKRYKDPMTRDPQTGKERDFKMLHMQDVTLNNGPKLGQPAGQPATAPGSPLVPPGPTGGQPPPAAGATPNDDENDSEPGTPPNPQVKPDPSSPVSSGSSPGSSPGGGFNGPVFGGGPILGVASTSKAKTIREFDKKNHYNDWMFIYDPTSDRGGLLVGPWQTPTTTTIPGATPAGQMPGGQPPQGGPGRQPQNPLGQPPQNPEQNSPPEQ